MTTTTTLAPCRETILRFLGALTEDVPEGIVEIAWNPYSDGDPSKAQQFPSTNLDDICAHAASINTHEGVNAYYAPALRRPDCPQGKRTGKAHVLGSQWVWGDFDRDADAAKARCKALGLMPTVGVLTGSQPEKRTQMLWRLDDFVTDIAAIERMLRALKIVLNGDGAVVDASRLMRLPGSISWPKPNKPGRIPEIVKLSLSP